MKQKIILVIGSGGIAQRHIKLLKELEENSYIIVLKRKNSNTPFDLSVDEVISGYNDLDVSQLSGVVIASPASLHADTTCHFLENNVPVLLEKPIADTLEGALKIRDAVNSNPETPIIVGYCLRYLESLNFFQKILHEGVIGTIRSAQINVGQYLPDWRPKIDYRNSVSAQKKLGGGALLELSHELDYIQRLFGKIVNANGIISTIDDLEMDADNHVDLLMRTQNAVLINCHMDLLSRKPIRLCHVIGSTGSAQWDYHTGKVTWQTDGEDFNEKIFPCTERDIMYRRQMELFLSKIDSGNSLKYNIDDSFNIIKLIDGLRNVEEFY